MTSGPSTYWVIAVPSKSRDSARAERQRVDRATQDRRLSYNYDFEVPHDLRVGTLDSLMSLTDVLTKTDQVVEQYVKRLQRSYLDLSSVEIKGVEKFPSELFVNGKIPDKYIQEFSWNKAKYPLNTSLQDLSNSISQTGDGVNKLLSGRLAKLNEARGFLQAIDRRETGSLLTRPLSNLIDEKHMIEKEYITTVLAIISKNRQKEWECNYETLEEQSAIKVQREKESQTKEEKEEAEQQVEVSSEEIRIKEDIAKLEEQAMAINLDLPILEDYKAKLKNKKKLDIGSSVVPRSAKIVYDKDEEYLVYRVIIFKKGLENFKLVCREFLYYIRQYKYDHVEVKTEERKKEQVQLDVKNFHLSLLRWCQPQYSDLFSAWVHLKAIRTFVESVLRFGLPVNFTALFVKPLKGKEKAVRRALEDLYQHLGSVHSKTGATEVDFTGLAGDFYPYVYIPIEFGEKEDDR